MCRALDRSWDSVWDRRGDRKYARGPHTRDFRRLDPSFKKHPQMYLYTCNGAMYKSWRLMAKVDRVGPS